jgi:hypothetical protein
MNPGWWDRLAFELQRRNRETESAKEDYYTDEHARRAAVYTREDLALVVSYLSSANRQLAQIGTTLVAIAVGVGLLVVATTFLAIAVYLRSA